MSELKIEQIKFFHALNLQPISNVVLQKWTDKIEKYLIHVNDIKECFVSIQMIDANYEIKIKNSLSSARYGLRKKKKKKRCCCMC